MIFVFHKLFTFCPKKVAQLYLTRFLKSLENRAGRGETDERENLKRLNNRGVNRLELTVKDASGVFLHRTVSVFLEQLLEAIFVNLAALILIWVGNQIWAQSRPLMKDSLRRVASWDLRLWANQNNRYFTVIVTRQF